MNCLTNTDAMDDKAFPVAAARTWNSLPSEVTWNSKS